MFVNPYKELLEEEAKKEETKRKAVSTHCLFVIRVHALEAAGISEMWKRARRRRRSARR